ncbi:MAG: hypothetical protein NTZ05_20675 [Chloroflexi bacterium]|nr:hypothetical protein [Chloroflexota bacterium]
MNDFVMLLSGTVLILLGFWFIHLAARATRCWLDDLRADAAELHAGDAEASDVRAAMPGFPPAENAVRQWDTAASETTADAVAYNLALDVLGDDAFALLGCNRLLVPSRLNPDRRYRMSPNHIDLETQRGVVLGGFCLTSRSAMPEWDVVLSRYFMVSYAEMAFLRTANFIDHRVSDYYRMDRKQFATLFGKENLLEWDSYTSSAPAAVTIP